jgi:hypothetical protein
MENIFKPVMQLLTCREPEKDADTKAAFPAAFLHP